MDDFIKTHSATLKFVALILMLAIPFLLYQAAIKESFFLVNLLLGLMMVNMLFVMKKG